MATSNTTTVHNHALINHKKQVMALAESIRLHSTVHAFYVETYYRTTYPLYGPCDDLADHPYYLHLEGKGVPGIDKGITVISVDTGLPIVLSTTVLSDHPLTRSLLLTDKTVRREIAKDIPFGTDRLQGYLNPMDVRGKKDGTILAFNPTLVGLYEFSLIGDLQEGIYRAIYRWKNSGYVLTDRLYNAGWMAILQLFVYREILAIQAKYMGTEQASDFHIDARLAEYEISALATSLSDKARWELYRELGSILREIGSSESQEKLRTILFGDKTVTEYHIRPSLSKRKVLVRHVNGVYDSTVATSDHASVLGYSSALEDAVSSHMPVGKLYGLKDYVQGRINSVRDSVLDLLIHTALTDKVTGSLTLTLKYKEYTLPVKTWVIYLLQLVGATGTITLLDMPLSYTALTVSELKTALPKLALTRMTAYNDARLTHRYSLTADIAYQKQYKPVTLQIPLVPTTVSFPLLTSDERLTVAEYILDKLTAYTDNRVYSDRSTAHVLIDIMDRYTPLTTSVLTSPVKNKQLMILPLTFLGKQQ